MATKKATTKKAPTKARAKSKAKTAPMKSFKVAPRPRPFITFKFTDQTVYWVVIGAAVIALGLYVANLQMKINDLYDQTTMSQSQSDMDEMEMDHSKHDHKRGSHN